MLGNLVKYFSAIFPPHLYFLFFFREKGIILVYLQTSGISEVIFFCTFFC